MQNIPLVGLGTWKISKEDCASIVYEAIKTAGIRHIDCACDYGNEVEVGQGIKRAIEEGVVTRDQLWVTSKLWNTYHRAEHVEMACRKTLADLGLEYVDLYLIHFPIALKFVPFEERYPPEWIYDPKAESPTIVEEANAPMHLTWKAMEALVDAQLAKNIGVCNFNVQLLSDLLSYAVIPPYLNQIELHPFLVQQALVDWCESKAVRVTAFSPLGSPSYVALGMDQGLGEGVLASPVVTQIAAAKGKTPAQVVLRWNIERGASVVPKSVRVDRLVENADVLDFSLSAEEVSAAAGSVIPYKSACLHAVF